MENILLGVENIVKHHRIVSYIILSGLGFQVTGPHSFGNLMKESRSVYPLSLEEWKVDVR